MDVRRIRLLVAGVAAGAVLALTAGVAGAAPTPTITPSSGLPKSSTDGVTTMFGGIEPSGGSPASLGMTQNPP